MILKLLGGIAGVVTGAPSVTAIVVALIGGYIWLRSDIASDEAMKCDKRVASIEKTQTTEADNRAQSADDAAEAVARAHARADLERVCKGDPACRDRPN